VKKKCKHLIENPSRTWNVCRNPKSVFHKKRVLSGRCAKCPLNELVETPSEKPQEAHTEPPEITPLGTLIYARTGWEPPPCPPGYVRRSSDLESDGAYILDPIRPLCKHLSLLVAEKGSCGYHRVKRRCCLIKSFVGPKTCDDCAYRENLDAGKTK
jgi:hypothetical protein